MRICRRIVIVALIALFVTLPIIPVYAKNVVKPTLSVNITYLSDKEVSLELNTISDSKIKWIGIGLKDVDYEQDFKIKPVIMQPAYKVKKKLSLDNINRRYKLIVVTSDLEGDTSTYITYIYSNYNLMKSKELALNTEIGKEHSKEISEFFNNGRVIITKLDNAYSSIGNNSKIGFNTTICKMINNINYVYFDLGGELAIGVDDINNQHLIASCIIHEMTHYKDLEFADKMPNNILNITNGTTELNAFANTYEYYLEAEKLYELEKNFEKNVVLAFEYIYDYVYFGKGTNQKAKESLTVFSSKYEDLFYMKHTTKN